MPKRTTFCNHYLAMSDHTECAAGVSYETFKGLKYEERPCFKRNGCAPGGCDLAAFPTPEEEAAEEAAMMARFANMGKARTAIVDQLGGPWKRGTPGGSGVIDCPVCGTGKLRFSRAGVNGHVHAACTTEKCVAWME